MALIETQPDAVALTYAHVVFGLAKDEGGQAGVEETLDELEQVVELARSDAKFGEFVASRIISAKDRQAALQRMFGGRVSDRTLNLLLVLNSNGRLGHFPSVVAALDRLVQNAFGRVEVDVFTATPLPEGDAETLRAKLREVLGKEPVLHAYTDESMIGGVRVQIGDQLIDGSIATQLRRIREQMATRGTATVRASAEKLFGADPSKNGH